MYCNGEDGEYKGKKQAHPLSCLLLLSPTPFFGIYAEYEGIEATPGLTDTVLLY